MMKKNQKQILIIAIVGILIVAGLALAPSFNLSLFATPNTTVQSKTIAGYTGTYTYESGPQYVHDKIRGKNILKGTTQEIFDDDEYVSSWYSNGDSEKITLGLGTGSNVLTWNAGHDYIGSPRRPSVLIGRYWWDVWYYPSDVDPTTGTGTKIVSKGNYNSAYIEWVAGSYNKRKFSNVETQYKTDYSKYALGGETEWWFPSPQPLDYAQTQSLTPAGISFKMIGQRTGTIKTQLVVEYCELSVWGALNSVFGYHYSYKPVQEDIAILKSGTGEVDATSKNSLSGVPGYEAEGTGDSYTRYVYKEGQTVTFHIKTGSAGPTAGETATSTKWKFEIFKPGTSTALYSELIGDNIEKDILYPISSNSFVAGGDNAWNYKLTNGLLVQSEGKIFVVDALEKIPGRTTITTDKTEYTLGEKVTVTCKANSNPNTLSPIVKFDAWAKWTSSTSSSYAWGPGYVTDLQVSGQTYSGRFTFTPSKTGNIYIRAHAIDQGGYAGAEPFSDTLIIVKAIPKYQVTVIVKDTDGKFVEEAVVTLRSVQGRTNAQGSVILTVESGTAFLSVSKTGYISVSREETISSAKTIYVVLIPIGGSGDTQDVAIDVYNAIDATKLDGVSVTIDTTPQLTDLSGSITFTGITTGTHTLSAIKSGYNDFSAILDVPNGLTAGRFAVQLIPLDGEPTGDTYQVIIDVIDSDTSEYVSGATVTLDTQTLTTDNFGTVSFDIVSGTYSLTITKEGYATKTDSIDISDATYHPVYITKSGGGGTTITNDTYEITISVSYLGGSVMGATIQFGEEIQTTGPSGAVTFNVPSGDKYLTISHSEYEFYAETISVTSDTSVAVSLTKGTPPSADGTCTLTITVRNSKDKSLINDASITTSIGGQSTKTVNGIATVEVQTGQTLIMVSKSGFTTFTRSIPINQNMAFTIDLIPIAGKGIPGFEMVIFIVAFGISLCIGMYRRKKRDGKNNE